MMGNLHVSFRSLLPPLIFLFVTGLLHASPTEEASTTHLLSFHQTAESITLKTNEGFLRIQLIDNEGILYFSFASDSVFVPPSDAVSAKPINGSTITRNSTETLDVRMGDIFFKIQKNPLAIRISTGADKRNEMQLTGPLNGPTGSGISLHLDTREKIMGGGARAIDINRRGRQLQLSNQANYGYSWGADKLNYSLPVFYSSKKYLIFFDAPQRATADIGVSQRNKFRIESPQKAFNFYAITGHDYQNLLQKYTRLTGTQPLPPLWALGNLQSRYGYQSQAELMQMVDSMIVGKYPLDAVFVDLYWFGKGEGDYRMGNLTWDEEKWPKPAAMIQNLKTKGIKTVLVTEPYFLSTSENHSEAAQNGFFGQDEEGKPYIIDDFFFGAASLIDVFNPKATHWFWEKHQPLIEQGVAGWWGDLGEPEKHPDSINYHKGLSQDLHNLYGHYWAKMLSDRYRKHHPKERLFNLVRAGYAGSQRYSIFPWSGDVARSWSGLKAQLPIMLTMSMSGIPYMHHDIGGYAGGEMDDELYTRWAQLGAFSPIYRPHGADVPSEPIYYSSETQKIVREFIELRYQLIPYIYTLAYRQTAFGEPLMRPLIYEQSDDYLVDIYDTYYFGKNFLVAPVLEPGQTSRKVELPLGAWFHYYSGTFYLGGRTVEVPAPLNEIPLFVKAGSFIPTVPLQQSLDLLNTDQITITYYHHESVKQSHDELYLDCGKNAKALEEGAYQLFTFKAQNTDKELTIDISHNNGIYLLRPGRRTIVLEINNWGGRPEQVRIDGKNTDFRYIPRTKQTQIEFTMGADPVNIRIK